MPRKGIRHQSGHLIQRLVLEITGNTVRDGNEAVTVRGEKAKAIFILPAEFVRSVRVARESCVRLCVWRGLQHPLIRPGPVSRIRTAPGEHKMGVFWSLKLWKHESVVLGVTFQCRMWLLEGRRTN